MDTTIASAVVLPEPESESPPPPASPSGTHKRRQSSISEQDPKRQRLNSIDQPPHADRRDSITTKPSNAPPTGRRERGRERRLFGAALGALSHNTGSAVQKRRSEIEKRQKAQREIDEQENDLKRQERLKFIRVQRQKEQATFEKESTRLRHENLRHTARFLRTETEPHLYYKPWETTPEEDQRIEQQIAEAEQLIRREQGELNGEPNAQGNEDGEQIRTTHSSERDADAEPSDGKIVHPITPQHLPQPTTNGGTQDEGPDPKDPERRADHAEELMDEAVNGDQVASSHEADVPAQEAMDEDAHKDLMDENGEEMVEATEDTVIY
ncbi:hypothetical protein BU24DRAFT_421743 [Aaosphaeria arxii CBS 175.79]|uniref:Pinin/SDK/MemA protein domain-containing protein n=1 Tax=Aaosphaeria arxii CBS 175.79 TaxID=1450172 RepID=A0A6A5XRR6_9PLEO|nr:uncharacterized protein BU24DRAFT_421743 [Aaosphaeria arxii CBS 175.79]KAF2015441.1 hypothetical protein BU24DRAFT_421743 [Aaosphaeria arxii CBS 175.79]